MILRSLAVLALTAAPALAEDPFAAALAPSLGWCNEIGGTRLDLPEGALTSADLTGDGTADDAILSEEGAFCYPDGGFLGGSGGHMIHLRVGDQLFSRLAGALLVQDIAFTAEGEVQPPVRVLLFALHGSNCDGAGASPCIEAVVWDDSNRQFRTVMNPFSGQDNAP